MNEQLTATAIAHSNIALVKYWGKLDKPGNYPAVPSLSLTLDALSTRTSVTFDHRLTQDEFILNEIPKQGRPLQRVVGLLDSVRSRAGLNMAASVVSHNNYPTASGLASSASGFAALALAASHAARLQLDRGAVSSLARGCSASAARSMFGGWATLEAGAESAAAFTTSRDWDISLLVVVTEAGEKALGSTEAMVRSARTSPCYSAWTEAAPSIFARACAALSQRDIDGLGRCMEESTWLMHATMLTAEPAVIYLAPASLAIIREVCNRRSRAIPAFFTTDAGAHVKVLTLARDAELVKSWVEPLPGVTEVVICRPGPEAYIVPETQEHLAL